MKIIFNGIASGLGNNGGSRTIILSAQTLEQLGHRCDIVGNIDNFKWFRHKPMLRSIPADSDAIINIAAVDYNNTKNSNVKLKAAWWRGHEIWSNTEDHLKYCYTDKNVKNFVNSKGLQKFLSSYGAESKVVYQGVDFELWEDRSLRKCNNKVRIGCLYNSKPSKRWSDFKRLAKLLGTKDYEYIGVGDTKREDSFLTYYFANASQKNLVDIYSSCDIWFAPTELEGLHNVPMEAGLCGCLVIANNHPMNGMMDYSFDNETTMVYESRDIGAAADLIKHPKWELVDNFKNHVINKIGDRKVNMIKMVKYLEAL